MASKPTVSVDEVRERKIAGKKPSSGSVGTRIGKTSSSATSKATLDEKMARAQLLKEQQEAERKKKLEEKHAREAQRLEAMAQRRKEMSQKKESGKTDGVSKLPSTSTGVKIPKSVKSNEVAPTTSSSIRSPKVSTKQSLRTTSSPSRIRSPQAKPSTSTTRATGTATSRLPATKKTATTAATKTSATVRPSSKPATGTSTTRTTTSRLSSGTTTTAKAGAAKPSTRKSTSSTTGLKKPSSTKSTTSADVKPSRIRAPTTTNRTTRDIKSKSPAKGVPKTVGSPNKKPKTVKEVPKKEEVTKPTQEEVTVQVSAGDPSVEIEISEQTNTSSGVDTEGSNEGLSKPIAATSFTPSTASRVGQIIATKTSLSKDLQTRLPSAGSTGETISPGDSQVSDDHADIEPSEVEVPVDREGETQEPASEPIAIPAVADDEDKPEPTDIPAVADEEDKPEPTDIPAVADEEDKPEPTDIPAVADDDVDKPEPTDIPAVADDEDKPEPTDIPAVADEEDKPEPTDIPAVADDEDKPEEVTTLVSVEEGETGSPEIEEQAEITHTVEEPTEGLESRLARVQSPGPELTLPDEFGLDWKLEKVEQEMKDEETRADRKMRVDEIMRKTRAKGEDLALNEVSLSLSPSPPPQTTPPPDHETETIEHTSFQIPAVDILVVEDEVNMDINQTTPPADGETTPTAIEEATPPDTQPPTEQIDVEDIRSSISTQDSFEFRADYREWTSQDQPKVETVQEEKADELVTFDLGESDLPEPEEPSSPQPEEPSSPPPEEPSSPPPEEPSSPQPEEPSSPQPEEPSSPPPEEPSSPQPEEPSTPPPEEPSSPQPEDPSSPPPEEPSSPPPEEPSTPQPGEPSSPPPEEPSTPPPAEPFSPQPEEPFSPPPEEPSSPPPEEPSSPPPEEPSSPPPDEPSSSPPDVEDIEESDEPLVSFDAQATSDDVLLMLPEDNDTEIQQLVDDAAQRIERMEGETTSSMAVKQDSEVVGNPSLGGDDLLSFGYDPLPEKASQPVSSDTDHHFETGGGVDVPTGDLFATEEQLFRPEGAQETAPTGIGGGVITSDLLNLGGEGNADLLDSSEVD